MDQQLQPRPGAEGFVWPTVGRPGTVPLNALVGDPNQPRKHFDDAELDSLAATIKKSEGPREIVTVRALTPEEQAGPYPLPARYMIVSGERRWRATERAGLETIEIRVKKYASRGLQKLDAYLLNEGRVGLTDMEHALYIAELAKEFGWGTQQEIAENIGKSAFWVSQHLALLNLSPGIVTFMMPNIPEEHRIKTQPALRIARDVKDFMTQEDLAGRMPKRLPAARQVAWLLREFKKLGIQSTTREKKPSNFRKQTTRFVEQTGHRLSELVESKAFEQVFSNASDKQIETLRDTTQELCKRLGDFNLRITEFADARLAERARVGLMRNKSDPTPAPAQRQVPRVLPRPVVRFKPVVEVRKPPQQVPQASVQRAIPVASKPTGAPKGAPKNNVPLAQTYPDLKNKLVPVVWDMFEQGKIDFTTAQRLSTRQGERQERQARLFVRKEITFNEI